MDSWQILDTARASLVHAPSSDTVIPKAAVPSSERSQMTCLWRPILYTGGAEILQCGGDQFLGLAIELRLESITTCRKTGVQLGEIGFSKLPMNLPGTIRWQ
jgi:hypothetical protein